MIGISPSVAGASDAMKRRESDADYAMGSIATAVDCIEQCGLTDRQWDRAKELLTRLKIALKEQDN